MNPFELPCYAGHAELADLIERTLAETVRKPREYVRGPKEKKPLSNNRGKLRPHWAAIRAKAKAGATCKDLAVEYECSAVAIAYILRRPE